MHFISIRSQNSYGFELILQIYIYKSPKPEGIGLIFDISQLLRHDKSTLCHADQCEAHLPPAAYYVSE